MAYPKMTVDLNIIKNNAKILVDLCNKKDIKIAGVSKVFCGNPEIAKVYLESGIEYLADSRIENLIRLKDIDMPKLMLRLPMKSEAEEIVEYADISLNSEIETIKILSDKALEKGKLHKIILMLDLGDLREGYYDKENLFSAVEEITTLKGVSLVGLATNLTCYGGVIPTREKLKNLIEIGQEIENKYNIKLEIISGGNSSSIYLLEDEKLEGINNLRLGESIILGNETAYGKMIKGCRNDGFNLHVEVLEVKEKPSLPTGQIGKDAFGNTPTFVDRGLRKRILCGIGKQDTDFDSLYPKDKDIIILGGSSDHLILDASDSKIDYKVGDIIEFSMTYVSILRSMTSEYVEKQLI